MTVAALTIFEELRFILELTLAEHLFALMFSRRRENFILRAVPFGVLLTVIAALYPHVIMPVFDGTSYITHQIVSISWYILLTLATTFYIWFCYDMTMADTMFLCVAAYALQHVEYVMVNEVLALGIWESLPNHMLLYFVVCALSTIALYFIAFLIFRKNLQAYEGNLFEDTRQNIGFTTLMFFIMFIAAFMCQAVFAGSPNDYLLVNYLGATIDFLMCTLILWIQYGMITITRLGREKQIVEQLLYERKRQYSLSRENIETINHKCHDLKHQLRALKEIDSESRNQYIDELERSIDIYDAVLETGNEVVNTIISEKSLNCERRKIRLSYIVDASRLDFMSTLDIYALLGNALDNAIETVSTYKNEDKRVISLTIKAVGDFLSIQTNNYCEADIKFKNGIPVTSKHNKEYHGFGMKSMSHIAAKYGGSLAATMEDHIFTLQILLPMPKEFVRLYNLAKKTK